MIPEELTWVIAAIICVILLMYFFRNVGSLIKMKIETKELIITAVVIIGAVLMIWLFVFVIFEATTNNHMANDLAKSYCEEKDQTFFLRDWKTSTFKCLDKDRKVFEYGLTEKENILGEKEQ